VIRVLARATALVGALAMASPTSAKPSTLAPGVGAPVRVRSPGRAAARPKVAVAPPVLKGMTITADDITAQVRSGIAKSVELAEPDAEGVTHVVTAEITADEKIYDVHIVATDMRTREVVAETREACEVCGVAEVVELAHRQSAALGERLSKLTPLPGRLDIRSRPGGATITVDDATIGSTPLDVELDAGPHRLQATLAGHAPRHHDVVAVGGVREVWSFDLQPLRASRRDTRMRTAGWVLLGIGSAAVVPGVVFLALDGRPNRTKCSGDDVDADGDCRQVYEGTISGAVLTSLGLALVATGIALVVSSRRRGKRGSRH
jgi:hypothetical protein